MGLTGVPLDTPFLVRTKRAIAATKSVRISNWVTRTGNLRLILSGIKDRNIGNIAPCDEPRLEAGWSRE